MARLDQALDRAIETATWAPSSHNSQPWAVAIVSSDAAREQLAQALGVRRSRSLVLCLDRDRELRALPAHQLEMYLSCGMYLGATLRVLSGDATHSVDWVADEGKGRGDLGIDLPERWAPLAVIGLEPAENEVDLELAALITRRITNRAPYRDAVPDAEVLARLSAARSPFGEDPTRILAPQWITARSDIEAIGDFVARHAGIDFSHREAWRETYAFIRFGAAEARAAEDGFPITQLFGPMSWWSRTFYRVALAPATMRMLETVGYPRQIAKGFGALVSKQTPALLALAFSSETPSLTDQLAGGAKGLDLWLRAEREGLVLHPLSVVLQHPEIRLLLQEEHGLSGRVFFFARVGYPLAKFPPAPRRRDPRAAVRTL